MEQGEEEKKLSQLGQCWCTVPIRELFFFKNGRFPPGTRKRILFSPFLYSFLKEADKIGALEVCMLHWCKVRSTCQMWSLLNFKQPYLAHSSLLQTSHIAKPYFTYFRHSVCVAPGAKLCNRILISKFPICSITLFHARLFSFFFSFLRITSLNRKKRTLLSLMQLFSLVDVIQVDVMTQNWKTSVIEIAVRGFGSPMDTRFQLKNH